jgi:GntR family transcriptional regulator
MLLCNHAAQNKRWLGQSRQSVSITVMKSLRLNTNLSTPLHTQVANQLEKQVKQGKWKPGEKIISERELMELGHISRATVRQAISSLVQTGVLEKIQGAGTFVKQAKIEQPMNIVYSFSQQLKSLGLKFEDRLLNRELLVASDDLAERLQIRRKSKVIYINRLRLIDGEPFMISKAYVPHSLCPELVGDELETSLYSLLVDRYGLPVVHATDKVEALQADKETSKRLKLSANVPILFVERLAYTTGERILHLGLNYIRGDRCFFRIDLSSQASTLEVKP